MKKGIEYKGNSDAENYFIPAQVLKETSQQKRRGGHGRSTAPLDPIDMTYSQFIETLDKRAGEDGMPSSASCANVKSAVRSFCHERGFDLSACIGDTFQAHRPPEVMRHCSAAFDAEDEHKVAANRRSNLMACVRAFRVLEHEYAALTGSVMPFHRLLREVLDSRKLSIKKAAKASGISYKTLCGLVSGKIPSAVTMSRLPNLESLFGMDAGDLTSLVPKRRRTEAPPRVRSPRSQDWARLSADQYRLKPSQVIPSLRQEFGELKAFKTRGVVVGGDPFAVDKENTSKHAWRLRQYRGKDPQEDWVGVVGNMWCPSASKTFGQFSSYFGYLQLTAERGGMGMLPEQAQRLANIADRDLLAGFCRWYRARHKGNITTTIQAFLVIVSVHCRPRHGFLWLYPERFVGNDSSAQAAWRAQCEEVVSYALETQRSIRSSVRPTRDPREDLAPILAVQNPLDVIADAIKRMRIRAANASPKYRLTLLRDIALVALAASNPLRLENLMTLTWMADNSGQLRQDKEGRWSIYIEKQHLKNYECERDYDMPVQPEVWPLIEEYLAESRPEMAHPDCNYFFVARTRKNEAWDGLDDAYRKATMNFIPNCWGYGIHSIRHIVATTLVRRYRRFTEAARALHDEETTVRSVYGHLLGTDIAEAFAEPFSEAFKGLTSSRRSN